VLPLATAYAVAEALGAPKGVNLDFRRAPLFFGRFTAIMLVGVAAALVPGLPVVRGLLLAQVLNGALLPVMLVFMLRLSNDPALMGPLRNSRLVNLLGWGTWALITTAVVTLFAWQLLEALGWL
jgi:Mn2+/Fe2+ NRAMP family transporter